MPREQYEIHWKDYYKLLEVTPDADRQTIQRAWHRLSRFYHPDVAGPSGDLDLIKRINEAYDVLSDPQRRSTYDQIYRVRELRRGSTRVPSTRTAPKVGAVITQTAKRTSRPAPSFTPRVMDLGAIRDDEHHRINFTAENLGGAATWIRLDYFPKEPWLSVDTQVESLPCDVYVTVDPRSLEPDKTHSAQIRLTLDGVVASASIVFRVKQIRHQPGQTVWNGLLRIAHRFPLLRRLVSLFRTASRDSE